MEGYITNWDIFYNVVEIDVKNYKGTLGLHTGPWGFALAGFPGPQGPQGSTGPQGQDGHYAGRGFQGVQGPQGAQGLMGYQGLDGGYVGQGYQGVQGAQGYQGTIGPAGQPLTQSFQQVSTYDYTSANFNINGITLQFTIGLAGGNPRLQYNCSAVQPKFWIDGSTSVYQSTPTTFGGAVPYIDNTQVTVKFYMSINDSIVLRITAFMQGFGAVPQKYFPVIIERLV